MTILVKPLRSGQITIPASIRRKLGIDRDTLLQISLNSGEIRVKPIRIATDVKDSTWFKELYKNFGSVRQEAKSYTEKEINTAIKSAVTAVRKAHD